MCSEIHFSASPLYMFRAAHMPIIRSTILTVSTAVGTIHSRSQIVSVTSSQRSLALANSAQPVNFRKEYFKTEAWIMILFSGTECQVTL